MEYDVVLCMLVAFSSLAGLAMILTRVRPLPRGWMVVYSLLSALSVYGWIGRQTPVIYTAGVAWFFLALLPALIGRFYQRCFMQQRYAAARRLAEVLRFLHPADGFLELPHIVLAFELAQRGDLTAG